jgi:hypothetical protein
MYPGRLPDRRLAYWAAHHDNGWVTNVLANPDGTYSAWASLESTLASVDYIEIDVESAMRAAEFALRRKSGHVQCSPRCTRWTVHSLPLEVPEHGDADGSRSSLQAPGHE